ncbi:hypothetical protein E3V08_02460 [Candidatus Atribacteria bacterium MT.SAG.1]|nr:hypothetical protein E3V08_02460 [Candidatus Atribacteria bacterium MT.SAG.1]
MIFFFIVSKITGENEHPGREMAGCLAFTIGGIVLGGILMSLTVVFLFPILLGQQSITPISEVLNSLWPIIKAGLIATGIVTIITIMPLVGSLIAYSPGAQTFLMGFIIFTLFTRDMFNIMLSESNIQSSIYPTIWEFIGFIIIATALTWLLIGILSVISLPFSNTELGYIITMIGGQVLGVLAGIITLCMYTNFIMLSFLDNISY